MMLPLQFVIRLFLAALLPLGVVLPALAISSSSSGRAAPLAASPERSAMSQDQSKADATVEMAAGGFKPATVSVKPGQTVRFVNKDDRDYSLTTSDKKLKNFASGTVAPKNEWTYRVPGDTAAGSYAYNCKLRPRAKGTIKVAP